MMQVAEETVEITVRRYETFDGETKYGVETDDGRCMPLSPHLHSVTVTSPDRQPLIELAYKGRFNAIKEL